MFQPYTMVNDHRTELKIPDVQKVMDGGIDPFIKAYLKQIGAAGATVVTRRAQLRPAGAAREAGRVSRAASAPFAYRFQARRTRAGATPSPRPADRTTRRAAW